MHQSRNAPVTLEVEGNISQGTPRSLLIGHGPGEEVHGWVPVPLDPWMKAPACAWVRP